MKHAKTAAALLLACAIVLLSGCQNQISLNKRMLIQGIGIDKDEGGFQVTVQVSNVNEGGGGEVNVLQAKGETTLDALNNATLSMGKKPMYSHNMIVVIGRDCAESGIDKMIDFFIRQQETRPTVEVFLAEGSAQDVLNVKNEEKKVIKALDISELSAAGKWSGVSARVRVLDLVNHINNEGSSPYLPVLKQEEKKVAISGAGIFSGTKLKKMLNEDRTRGLLLAAGEFTEGKVAVEAGDSGKATLSIVKSKTKTSVSLEQGIPHFSILISCEANIGSIDQMPGTKMGDDAFHRYQQALEKRLQKEARGAVQECVVENGCDVFYFGRLLLQKEPGYWREHGGSWNELMKQARYEVTVKADVEHVGQEITPTL